MAVPNMGIPNLQLNPFLPGATRFFELTFPRFGIVRSTGGFPALEANTRGGQTLTSATTLTNSGTGTQIGQFYKNYPTEAMVCAAGADISAVSWAHDIYPFLDKLGNDQTGFPFLVYRYIFALAYPTGVPANKEIGVLMTCGNQTLLNGTRAGILFGPRSDTVLGLGIRRVAAGGNVVDYTSSLPDAGVADLTNINTYEMRIVSATGSRNALFNAFINGRQFGPTVDCGSTSLLFPNLNADGTGFMGFRFGVANNAPGVAYTMHLIQMHAIVAPIADDGF